MAKKKRHNIYTLDWSVPKEKRSGKYNFYTVMGWTDEEVKDRVKKDVDKVRKKDKRSRSK